MKRVFILFGFIILFTNTVLAQDKSLSVCTLEWAPYIGKNLPGNGWAWALIKEVMETKGYKLNLQIHPWVRSVHLVKNGSCDALCPPFYSKERAQWAWFSAPFTETRSVFFKLKDKDIDFNSLQDLKSYKIGVVRSYVITPEFDAADYLDKVEITDVKNGFQMIYMGRLDLMPLSELAGKTLLKEIEATGKFPGISQKIIPMEPPIKVNDIYLAFSKKDPDSLEKLRDFNSGLAKLYRNGRYNELLKEYGLWD
jgi:polar amino acid transport system substrate-binding protein